MRELILIIEVLAQKEGESDPIFILLKDSWKSQFSQPFES